MDERDERLCDACRVGDFEKAKKALEDGANPSVQFRLALGEITPIFLCASKGYKNIAELLIEYNANINRSMDFDGTICLHHAASNDQPEMCDFLISKGILYHIYEYTNYIIIYIYILYNDNNDRMRCKSSR